MIYLFGYLFYLVRDVAAPAVLVGLLAWLALWLPRRRGGLRKATLALLPALLVGVLRHQALEERFTHTERYQFKTYVAAPIPATLSELAMAVPSPEMFHDGALVQFKTDAATFSQLVHHTLPGSRFPALRERIAGAAMQTTCGGPELCYLRWDPAAPPAIPPIFSGLTAQAERLGEHPDTEFYVLGLAGERWMLEAWLYRHPATGGVELRQHILRRANGN